MRTYLLDSDVVINHLRGKTEIFAYIGPLDPTLVLGCSVVTQAEVLAGMRPSERETSEDLLKSFVSFPVTEDIAEKAAEYIRLYRSRGITLLLDDCFIAATAHLYKATLVTLNTKHFPMLDDVLSKPRF